jgi:Kef-type K+ transport system membrane component KefB
MQMMDGMFGSAVDWPVYTLIIVVVILGLISIYLSYMILAELKEMKSAFERVEKLLKSVE